LVENTAPYQVLQGRPKRLTIFKRLKRLYMKTYEGVPYINMFGS